MSLAMVQMIRESIEKIVLYAHYDRDKPEYHNSSYVFCLTINEMAEYVHPGGDQTPVFEIDSILICAITIGNETYVRTIISVINMMYYYIVRMYVETLMVENTSGNRGDFTVYYAPVCNNLYSKKASYCFHYIHCSYWH